MSGKLKTLCVLACCVALCVLAVACGPKQLTTQELIDQKDTWAEGVLRAALDDLAKQGVIDTVPKDAALLSDAFEYDGVEGDYDIVYKDAQAAASITGDFTLPAGKVALCDPDSNDKMNVYYKDGKTNEYYMPAPEGAPFFYPQSLNGRLSKEGLEALLDGVEPSRFADDFNNCDYLIAFDDVLTHVDENFYFGSIDRTSCTTFIVVVDAKAKKVLHIENVGTDTPAKTVKSGGEVGQMLYDELIADLNALLK